MRKKPQSFAVHSLALARSLAPSYTVLRHSLTRLRIKTCKANALPPPRPAIDSWKKCEQNLSASSDCAGEKSVVCIRLFTFETRKRSKSKWSKWLMNDEYGERGIEEEREREKWQQRVMTDWKKNRRTFVLHCVCLCLCVDSAAAAAVELCAL